MLTEDIEVIEETNTLYSDLLTRQFENGQSPLSLVLNYPSDSHRELIELVLSQNPPIGTHDLPGLGRCEEFKEAAAKDSAVVNQPDPDGNTPLLTAIYNAPLLENGECVRAVLQSGAVQKVPAEIRNSLGNSVSFEPDSKLLTELVDLLPREWDSNWYNEEIGRKIRLFHLEVKKVRDLSIEDLLATQ